MLPEILSIATPIITIATPIITIATPLIAILALIIAIFTWRSNLRASRVIQHYNLVTQADSMFAGNQELLRFHGINPDTIEEKYGVTSHELSYLLQSFNSGSISNLLSNEKYNIPFEKGSYRYDILKNEPTQRAFPLVKLLFDSKNIYISRCEETIRIIKNLDTNNTHDKGT